ncbi:protein MHF2 homolog [Oryza brachyantha]|uniref:Centromere protein X n=1 Tax=Oryza brachyantha TaxID=4533 RepID=J3LYY7_ORYBR|nr:protein MHF2 homolog [Oryza brachyantha]
MDEEATRGETFDPDLIHAIFKLVWSRRGDRGGGGGGPDEDAIDVEPVPETSRRNRSATANASALKVSCELLRIFVTEAVQRSAFIAEAEGTITIEPTHLERVLPQLLLDF